MHQTWNDLLFAHWPIPVEVMRPLVPAGLELDTFDGTAWVGVVPFHMTNVAVRSFIAVPSTSKFPELNVRTYVTLDGKAGVYFFSLDAASALAVATARQAFFLPYFNARMSVVESGNTIYYSSQRTHRSAPSAVFIGNYGPTGEVYHSQRGTLESWLTERYCLYSVNKQQRVYRGDIHHLPWPLQPAQAHIQVNTMTQPHGIELPDREPLLHFARRLDVVVWPLRRVR
jgi:uncharacterized protein YqjF (DUF2071 family)